MSSQQWRRAWPHIRAALLLLHVLGVFLMALPAPSRVGTRQQWESPKQQAEFRLWADRLGVDKEELQSFLWTLSRGYLRARQKVVRPFLQLADYTGARQGWSMFASPRRVTGRFEISVEEEGHWRLVFRGHDDDADWNRWQFDHNRVRKLLGRLASKPHRPVYNEFTRWVARSLASDFPAATRAKIALFTWKLPEPEEVRAGEKPEVHRTQYQEFDLDEYR